jgi:hypothetical protein
VTIVMNEGVSMNTTDSQQAHRVDTRVAQGPCITPTRRGLLHRAVRQVRMAWLRFKIHSNEEWIENCEAQGIRGTVNLQYTERETQALRVELAIVEAS